MTCHHVWRGQSIFGTRHLYQQPEQPAAACAGCRTLSLSNDKGLIVIQNHLQHWHIYFEQPTKDRLPCGQSIPRLTSRDQTFEMEAYGDVAFFQVGV